ncbi:DUF2336 domain-containing protein [Ancylobacter defluvii]|uniref:DUF2336 domain-containing protein n=1 Tax=Ancylobacter defluvii TaxID=1282440 RepID=A0A9W6JVF6_9HYPH|nr:DUF2336 domain-containing protein [Ancylobacter defluvii]MBS7588896.1 DUF2336 domain-containing protein [Ancylobacter defluvii]GLK84496.1 hypothetical protein GCM10017653_25660 [Ancylobacter defluvii]
MIVHQYLLWAKSVSDEERGRGLGMLAGAYARGELDGVDALGFEAALPVLAQDPYPPARLALAEALCRHPRLPDDLALRLAELDGEPGLRMLAGSPVLNACELIEMAEAGSEVRRAAIAARTPVTAPVAAALAEIAGEEACLALVGNPAADLPGFALGRIVARHGHAAALREMLLARRDLPAGVHQALIRAVANALSVFVVERGRRNAAGEVAEQEAGPEQQAALETTGEAHERAVVAMVGRAAPDLRALAGQLQQRGELTPAAVLKALLSGRMRLFLEMVALLTGLPIDRVAALAADRSGDAFRILYDRLGLPYGAFTAFRSALHLLQKEPYLDDEDVAAGLQRRIVEEALYQYARLGETAARNPVVALLERWRDEEPVDELGTTLAA